MYQKFLSLLFLCSYLMIIFQILNSRSIKPTSAILRSGYVQNSKYFIGTWKANFMEARTYCQLLGMDLVNINDAEEHEAIKSYISTTGGEQYYMSMNKLNDYTWRWLNGVPATYMVWWKNQPDNQSGNEWCTAIYAEGGTYSDLACNLRIYYICERLENNAPEPQEPQPQKCNCPAANPASVVTVNINRNEKASSSVNGNQLEFINVNGTKYFVGSPTSKVTHSEAKTVCKFYDMELISINNQEKYNIVANIVLPGAQSRYWTSGYKVSDHENWVWGDGGMLTYKQIWATEKANYQSKNGICLALDTSRHGAVGLPCDTELDHFICESAKLKVPCSETTVNIDAN